MTKIQFIINNIGLIVGLSLVMFVVGYAASEWEPPTDVPPRANAEPPINQGIKPQWKNGNLGADLVTAFGGFSYKTKLGLSVPKCASNQGLNGVEVSGGIITDGVCGAGTDGATSGGNFGGMFTQITSGLNCTGGGYGGAMANPFTGGYSCPTGFDVSSSCYTAGKIPSMRISFCYKR